MCAKLNIALYGTGGVLFEPITQRLLESYKGIINLPLRGLTRDASKKVSTYEIKYFTCESDDLTTFKSGLECVDVLINLAGSNWDPPIAAAVALNIDLKLYIGPQFGTELDKSLFVDYGIAIKFQHTNHWRTKGNYKTVDLVTSLFVDEWIEDLIIFDYNRDLKEADIYGFEDDTIDISYFPDIAWAVGEIIKQGNNNGFKTLMDRIRISSDKIQLKQLFDKFEEKNNVKVIKHIHAREVLISSALELAKKNFTWNDIYFYLKAVVASGVDKGASFSVTENEYINPDEVIFKWTKFH